MSKNTKTKPIICLDFDGVIHSYTSGWQGPRIIPDEPVPGALEFIVKAQEDFIVAIYSSRSHALLGRMAMKAWLKQEFVKLCPGYERTPKWLADEITKNSFADPWEDEVDWAVNKIVNDIEFRVHKPPALVTIDDRAIQFNGVFPGLEEIKQFKPWNK